MEIVIASAIEPDNYRRVTVYDRDYRILHREIFPTETEALQTAREWQKNIINGRSFKPIIPT